MDVLFYFLHDVLLYNLPTFDQTTSSLSTWMKEYDIGLEQEDNKIS